MVMLGPSPGRMAFLHQYIFPKEEEMGKQEVIDAVKGLPTQKVPWVPYVGVHGAYLIGEPADKYLQDPDLICKGVCNAAERYKADGVPLLFDLTVEAISMG